MKNLSKYLLIVFLALFCTFGVFGDWNGTFYVDVLEGDDDCDSPAFTGTVRCILSNSNWDEKPWGGYLTYTFNLTAPHQGYADGTVQVQNSGDDPISCYGFETETWGVPPTPSEIRITVEPEYQ